jgi:hypothetical protein
MRELISDFGVKFDAGTKQLWSEHVKFQSRPPVVVRAHH